MDLLGRINHYLEAHGMSPTRFGRIAANDSRLVEDMRRGRVLRPRTRAKVLALLDGERPR